MSKSRAAIASPSSHHSRWIRIVSLRIVVAQAIVIPTIPDTTFFGCWKIDCMDDNSRRISCARLSGFVVVCRLVRKRFMSETGRFYWEMLCLNTQGSSQRRASPFILQVDCYGAGAAWLPTGISVLIDIFWETNATFREYTNRVWGIYVRGVSTSCMHMY